jgi:hypothetical protein
MGSNRPGVHWKAVGSATPKLGIKHAAVAVLLLALLSACTGGLVQPCPYSPENSSGLCAIGEHKDSGR